MRIGMDTALTKLMTLASNNAEIKLVQCELVVRTPSNIKYIIYYCNKLRHRYIVDTTTKRPPHHGSFSVRELTTASDRLSEAAFLCSSAARLWAARYSLDPAPYFSLTDASVWHSGWTFLCFLMAPENLFTVLVCF